MWTEPAEGLHPAGVSERHQDPPNHALPIRTGDAKNPRRLILNLGQALSRQGLILVTVRENLNDLMLKLESAHQEDFRRLSIRNYGFQAPGLLDPTKARNGYRLSGAIGINAYNKPVAVPVLLGKIAPVTLPVDESEESMFALLGAIGKTICEWEKCEAIGLAGQEFSVRTEFRRDQNKGVAGNNPDAHWWVMVWQFELKGYFDDF